MRNWKWSRSGHRLLWLGVTLGLVTLCLAILWWVSASRTLAVAAPVAGQKDAAPSNGAVITIGVGVDLSGPGAGLGWQEANSVQLAISQTNEAGGVDIGGVIYTVTLVMADSGCSPAQAVTAANTLLDAGAVAVVGPTCSSAAFAAQPIYNAAGVPMITPSASSTELTQQGYTTTFRTVPHDGSIGALMATYGSNELGLSRSAIVETSWWLAPGDAYSNTVTALGGAITSRRVASDTSYFTATLQAIQAEDPDVIANFYYEPDPAPAGGLFSRIAYSLGMTDVVIFWNSDSDDQAILDAYADAAGMEAAENDYAAMRRPREDMPGWPAFLAAYQAAGFPNEPDDPGVYGAYAYDGTGIIIAAMDRANSTDPAAIRDEIAATQDYQGVVGIYEGFDSNGDVIPQWASLHRYRNGQWGIAPSNWVFLPIVLRDS